MIKKKIIGFTLFAVTAIMACSSAAENKPVETAQVAREENVAADNAALLPSFTMKDVNGNAINLQSLKGKKVFVNLWASWCPPCRAEMPSIEKLYASVDKNKVTFVMLSFDENPEASTRFIQSNKLSFPIYFPAEQPPAILQTDGIPATFIFDESGKLIKQNSGTENYDTDEYRQMLK